MGVAHLLGRARLQGRGSSVATNEHSRILVAADPNSHLHHRLVAERFWSNAATGISMLEFTAHFLGLISYQPLENHHAQGRVAGGCLGFP